MMMSMYSGICPRPWWLFQPLLYNRTQKKRSPTALMFHGIILRFTTGDSTKEKEFFYSEECPG
ncbi:hypothetical protein OS493_040011 [Desmophyllum pertusum]|uniref:Uncharacterized protein n=1 Tax=Desmophyllum pertusum TaxID=174260 RepID=A0A9W9Z8T5_9CNID|nr:hypothetical protein OS493_040011 [Desmophyllum pertusum]